MAARPQTDAAEPKIAAFLDLFDRAEQEELTYRTLAAGTIDDSVAPSGAVSPGER